MAEIAYEDWNPNAESQRLVQIADDICRDMKAQGYDLTLRQLYYQFVARGHIENTERSYKNLGNLVNKARLAGLLDWDFIEDRTRNVQGLPGTWTPREIIAHNQYQVHSDRWQDQEWRVEVWVEKEALVSVVAKAARRWDVARFACRGYVSQSELHAAAQRHLEYEAEGFNVVVIHLGDHDPSGIDMTRDMQERLSLFGASTRLDRIALNMDQINHYAPPPNPAKITDSRAGSYIARFGRSSWELDALTPRVIDDLVSETIGGYVTDEDAMEARKVEEQEWRKQMRLVSDRWDDVLTMLGGVE